MGRQQIPINLHVNVTDHEDITAQTTSIVTLWINHVD
jgi:hypothetical protein